MSRWTVAALALVLYAASVAQAEPLVPKPGSGLSKWRWSALATNDKPLRIELARADVITVLSADDRISVQIAAQGTADDAERLWIDVTQEDGAYVLTDRFPRRSAFALIRECLPPSDERGDIWSIATRLRVIVAAPPGYHPKIIIIDGTINGQRAPGR